MSMEITTIMEEVAIMAQDIISTVIDFIKLIAETVQKFTK
nr:delta-lysin family phenol-soluble modulin [Staphylococcus felis]